MSLARIHFVVHFADGETVVGADLCVCPTGNTGWRGLPDKSIAKLSLVNPHGDLLTLQGYEEYNFMVESLQALGQVSYMSDVYVMGARDGKVVVYRMRASRKSLSDPVQVGDIMVKVADRGKEYLGAETTGWKSASGGMEERNWA
ncbi:MAG: hypothetical protein A3E19_02525 [Planctomycetes bacterium RIFCSPHIGHO2_12_FULL_52_36]|nr:MAG: hypothetical protein A3D89_04365 [Planctomycetes bacterium RIFCSPHIGHO2_02_FULL_52_58]OHB93305.1 MAG: hypothetical protein A3E19_02525 [Planctomycetes bacterium RIFCSPHIGHO2_12_FULL_52_36]